MWRRFLETKWPLSNSNTYLCIGFGLVELHRVGTEMVVAPTQYSKKTSYISCFTHTKKNTSKKIGDIFLILNKII